MLLSSSGLHFHYCKIILHVKGFFYPGKGFTFLAIRKIHPTVLLLVLMGYDSVGVLPALASATQIGILAWPAIRVLNGLGNQTLFCWCECSYWTPHLLIAVSNIGECWGEAAVGWLSSWCARCEQLLKTRSGKRKVRHHVIATAPGYPRTSLCELCESSFRLNHRTGKVRQTIRLQISLC